jgi:polysaccharide biosynthesis protein PslG
LVRYLLLLLASLAFVIAAGITDVVHARDSLQDINKLIVPNSFGLAIHFTHPRQGELEMIKNAGFRWARIGLYWHKTEVQKGVYDFSEYDNLLSHLKNNNIQPLMILAYGNPLYDNFMSSNSDEGRTAFTNWAIAAAKHFKNRGVIWEMYNEPDAGGWSPKPDVNDYLKLALSVGQAFQKNAPRESLIGPATSSSSVFPFYEACFKAGLLNYWDGLSVHPYRNGPPESVSDDYEKIQQLIHKYAPKGKSIPIISSEWGYPSSTWRPWRDVILDEDIQGKYLPRMFLSNLLNNIPLSIWYDWQNDGSDPNNPEHNFGITHNLFHKQAALEPKTAYLALKTLTNALEGYRYEKRIASDKDDYILSFKKRNTKQIRIAAWSSSNIPHEVMLPSELKDFHTISFTGEEGSSIVVKESGLSLKLTDSPQYLLAMR